MENKNKEGSRLRKIPNNGRFDVKACRIAKTTNSPESNPNPNYKPPIGIPQKTTGVRVSQVRQSEHSDHIVHINTGRISVHKTNSKTKRKQI